MVRFLANLVDTFQEKEDIKAQLLFDGQTKSLTKRSEQFAIWVPWTL